MTTSTIETGTTNYDALIAGDSDINTKHVILVSGQNVVRGELLGLVTASGKLATYDSSKSDGTQTAYAIAAEAKDASSGDQKMAIYVGGTFNKDALTLSHSGDTVTQAVYDALRTIGIFIKTNQRAVAN